MTDLATSGCPGAAFRLIGPGFGRRMVRDLRHLPDHQPEKRRGNDDDEGGEPEQVLGVHGVTTKARIAASIGIDRSPGPDHPGPNH